MSGRKGKQAEKELMDRVEELGFAPMRAPASGGGGQSRDLPDVLVGDGEHILAIEVKRSGKNQVYLTPAEVEALMRFAEAFHADATPVIAVRWDYDTTFYLAGPVSLSTTDSGNVSVTKDRSTTHWTTLGEYVAILREQ